MADAEVHRRREQWARTERCRLTAAVAKALATGKA